MSKSIIAYWKTTFLYLSAVSLFSGKKITFWTSTFTQGNCLVWSKSSKSIKVFLETNSEVINKWSDREYVQTESWKWLPTPPGTACVPFISFNRIYNVHSKLDFKKTQNIDFCITGYFSPKYSASCSMRLVWFGGPYAKVLNKEERFIGNYSLSLAVKPI